MYLPRNIKYIMRSYILIGYLVNLYNKILLTYNKLFVSIFNKLLFFFFIDPRMKNMWLMNSPWPIVIILFSYLYFVLKCGPEYMKFRNPMNIDRIVMIYNVVQVLLSLYIVERVIIYNNLNMTYHIILYKY